ncbi:MAG: EVE domain-containing protein [Candidatus Longimicrobiales bacterium M2_2A_002]
MADRQYWLMKSEPDVYSIDDLEADGRTHWDGVRNYQARNFMRDDMEEGDRVLFYHSNTNPPGVVGVAEVVREGYPDHTARDPDSNYYDEKATEDDPRWFMVDIAFVRKLPRTVPLAEIKDESALEDMVLVNRSRLSVQPVQEDEFERVVAMAEEDGE